MSAKYKRVLVINDDQDENQFFGKYKKLEEYREMILYCNDAESAFLHITSDDFLGCDKIILDIKIDWMIPEVYKEKIRIHIDMEIMEKRNKGFLIFMYLIARGYPISRIAFLSSYIPETDSDYEEKKKLLEEMKGWKKRTAEYDERLQECIKKIPSLESAIVEGFREIGDNKKTVEHYKKILKLLDENTKREEVKGEVNLDEQIKNDTNEFFELLSQTGLRITNKISKADEDRLKNWIKEEKDDKWNRYYKFRNIVLNICKSIENSEKKDIKIYSIYGSNKTFEENYPKEYFTSLIKKVEYEILSINEERDIEKTIENVVNDLVAYWESLDKTYIDGKLEHYDEETNRNSINNHALTMVLKHTRNWYTHGRIKNLDVGFCEFIFLVSITVIYGMDETLTKYLANELNIKENTCKNDNALYKRIWKDVNDKVISVKKLKTSTYTVNLVDLYFRYSNEKANQYVKSDDQRICLTIDDLYNMFILCLHYPTIQIQKEEDNIILSFHSIDYDKQEASVILLENIAIQNLGISKLLPLQHPE